jgi:hypothetical protein
MQLRTLVERQLADLDAMAAGPAAVPPGALNGEDGPGRPSSPTPAWLNSVARKT